MTSKIASLEKLPLLEKPYEWFDLWYTTRKRDMEQIKDMLTGKAALNQAPNAILNHILSPEAGKKTPICKSVVVERRYYDRDHARALSSFYSKLFRDIKRECIRLHFFSRRLSYPDLGNLEPYARDYLGFSVIRPFPYRKIGRTVLARLGKRPALEFPTCQGDFEANIGGSKLSVQGAAFMEQDMMVAACASAALWMSTITMARRFGLQECSPCEITERASQYLIQNRPMPSEGLICEQMLHALRTMDYDPILLGVESQEKAKHLIYSYVESQIPPILLCNLATGGHHAVIAVGHGYELPIENPRRTEVAWPNEPPLTFARSSEWVPYFLINDDQRGLYRKLTFVKTDARSPEEQIERLRERIEMVHPDTDTSKLDLEEWHCPVAIDMNMPTIGHFGGEEIANIWGVIIPLPQGVPLTSEQAERKAARLIRLWHDHSGEPLPDNLVLRTYLIPSNEYKQRIEDSGMHIFVKQLLRGKPMPRWIWVTEISSIDSYNSLEESRWLITGQVIICATGSAWTPDFCALHYIGEKRGILATMKPEHIDAEQALAQIWVGPDDVTPYPGWVRY